jgi:hypothetical protein
MRVPHPVRLRNYRIESLILHTVVICQLCCMHIIGAAPEIVHALLMHAPVDVQMLLISDKLVVSTWCTECTLPQWRGVEGIDAMA